MVARAIEEFRPRINDIIDVLPNTEESAKVSLIVSLIPPSQAAIDHYLERSSN